MSTNTIPGRACWTRPASPRYTSDTSRGNPTIVKTTSDSSATRAGESAHRAPRKSRPSAFDRVREKTVSACPLTRRCPAMAAPMTPVPIHPRRNGEGSVNGPAME